MIVQYAMLALVFVATGAYVLHVSITDAELWWLLVAVALFLVAALCAYMFVLSWGPV